MIPQPAVVSATRAFVGSPLSAPTTTSSQSVDTRDALSVHVRWTAIEKIPTTTLRPLDAQSRLTFAPLNKDAVLPVGLATRNTYFGTMPLAGSFADDLSAAKFGKTTLVSEDVGAVLPGSTLEFSVADALPESGLARRVVFAISRSSQSRTAMPATKPRERATISVRIDDNVSGDVEDSQGTPSEIQFVRETAIVDDVDLEEGSRFALVLPFAFKGTPWKALAAIVEVGAATDGDRAAFAQSLEDRNVPPTTGPASLENSAIASALAQLDAPGGLRAPLMFLATQTDSGIATDFVLVAEDELLNQFAQKIKGFPSGAASLPADAFGWMLDRTALELLADRAARPNAPPQIAALLSLHTGEVGRQADGVPEILKTVNSRPELERRLLAENMTFLEDDSPASRVRAFDWLSARGKAPPEFDPLGNSRARRAAIDKAIAAAGGAP